MVPISSGVLFLIQAITIVLLIAIFAGIFGAVWVKAWLAAIAFVVRSAHRIGLYDPDFESKNRRPSRSGRRDGWYIRLTRSLEFVSRLTPGSSGRQPHTIIVPLLLVGLPLMLLVVIVGWAVPGTLFAYVVHAGPDPWSTLLGALAIVTYFGALYGIWVVGKRAPHLLALVRSRTG